MKSIESVSNALNSICGNQLAFKVYMSIPTTPAANQSGMLMEVAGKLFSNGITITMQELMNCVKTFSSVGILKDTYRLEMVETISQLTNEIPTFMERK